MTYLLNSLSWILGHLPISAVQAFGRLLGRFVYLCSRRKKEIDQRIMRCLDVERKEARGIQRRMYQNLGMTAAEFLHMPYMREEQVHRLIEFRNLEPVQNREDGFIALVAHTGNWELMAAAASLILPKPLNVLVKTLKPESLDTWVKKTRSCWGTRIHDRRGSSRDALKVLRNNENLAFILDQNAKRNWGVFVDFFGESACTSDGLATLAAISGYPIYPVFCRRDPVTRRLIAEVKDEIRGPENRSPEEIHRVTQECTTAIEQFVRDHPDEWIWMHRRWRTRPDPDTE